VKKLNKIRVKGFTLTNGEEGEASGSLTLSSVIGGSLSKEMFVNGR
jgi:hypothetical protein